MRTVKLSDVSVACLDGARVIKRDGRSLFVNFAGRADYYPLGTYDTDVAAIEVYNEILRCLMGDDKPDTVSFIIHGGANPTYILRTDDIYLVSANIGSSSVDLRYRDGVILTLDFVDCAAAVTAMGAIVSVMDGDFGSVVSLYEDGRYVC